MFAWDGVPAAWPQCPSGHWVCLWPPYTEHIVGNKTEITDPLYTAAHCWEQNRNHRCFRQADGMESLPPRFTSYARVVYFPRTGWQRSCYFVFHQNDSLIASKNQSHVDTVNSCARESLTHYLKYASFSIYPKSIGFLMLWNNKYYYKY